MKKNFLAPLFLVTVFCASSTWAQDLRPALENGRPVLRFGDPKQCTSFVSFGTLDGEVDAFSVPVEHWHQKKLGEVGMLFFSRTDIVYRTLPIEHSFTISRLEFTGATVSVRDAVYYLTIKSTTKKEQEFKISCTVNPDVFSFVAMIANDVVGGTAEFKRLTSVLIAPQTRSGEALASNVPPSQKPDAGAQSQAAGDNAGKMDQEASQRAQTPDDSKREQRPREDFDEAAVEKVLQRANEHFLQGKKDLQENKRVKARDEFDKAIDAILSCGIDVRASQRLQSFYADLVEKIYAEEVPTTQTPQQNAAPVVTQQANAPTKTDAPEVAKTTRQTKQSQIGFQQQGFSPSPLDPLSKLILTDEEQKVSESQLKELEKAKNTLDFTFTINPLVQEYINYYQGRGRNTMSAGLRRSGRFIRLARETFRREGVPEDLTWLGQVESGWSPTARSAAAASGLWQFVPSTGAQYGLVQTAWVDERNGIEKPTQASARCLKDLGKRYHGDWLLALAAYNTGPQNVDRAIARAGVANYWQIYPYIAQETRNYVPNILAVILIAKDPEKYGFHGIRPEVPISYDPIVLPSTTSLRLIAEATDSTIDTIQSLNPELKRDTTPPGEIYTLRVPPGKWNQLSSVLKRVPLDRRDSSRVITMNPGESLQSVANRTGVNVATLQAMNPGVDLNTTNKLVVPNGNTRLTNWRRGSNNTESQNASNLTRVRARKGDTIAKIAAARKLSADEVARLNGILPDAELQAGQEIKLPNHQGSNSRER